MKINAQLFLSILFVCIALNATAQTGWLSDRQAIHLRDNPSSTYNPLETLYSGTALEIIEQTESATYQKVKAPSGKIGWINKKFVFEEPVSALKLEKLQEEYGLLKAEYDEYINVHRDTLKELEEKKALKQQLSELKSKYDSLELIASKQVELDSQNTELLENKAKLEYDLEQVQIELASYKSSNKTRFLITGAALVCLGVILCLILINLPKKAGRRDGWS